MSLLLYTDLSLSGWGVNLLDLTASRVWSKEESSMHINVLKMRAVSLALLAFLPQLSGQSVVLMSDSPSVVAYLRHQGGTVSCVLCHMASEIVLWVKWYLVALSARYILADQLSHPNQVLSTEWSLLSRVFEVIYKVFGRPYLNLFATLISVKLLLYMSTVPDQMAWKQDPSNFHRCGTCLSSPTCRSSIDASFPSDFTYESCPATYPKGRLFEGGCAGRSFGPSALHCYLVPVQVDQVPRLV